MFKVRSIRMCGRFTLSNRKLIKAKYGLSWQPSYNIAPSHNVLASTGNNILFTKPWGFSPAWYQSGKSLINARIESLNFKPSYKNVMRCVVLADGWYEWREEKGAKVPYYHHADGVLLFFAAIYGEGSGCAIVTAPSVGKLQSIHHRQPYLLLESEIQQWITGVESGMPYSSRSIKFHRVSKSVNDPNNNVSENIEPL